MAAAALQSAPATYFDGVTAARHRVMVACTDVGLDITDPHGTTLAFWPYSRLANLNAPKQVFRIGLRDSDRLARLEITDEKIARLIDDICPDIDRSDAAERDKRRSVLILSLSAIVSLLLVAFFGLPQISERLSWVVPTSVDRSLGRAADLRFRAMMGKEDRSRPIECGMDGIEIEGKKVFDALMDRIAHAAGVDAPFQAVVLRLPEANAFALAGGHVYVLQGLIDQAKDVDELAAIIAHELGHVANRDGIRSVLQNAGLSLIFGIVLGDFVGGAAVVAAAHLLLEAAYSREQELAADDFAVHTLKALGADPRALATFLDRVARTREGLSILLTHPSVPERVARIKAVASPQQNPKPLLSADEWQALRRICAAHP